MFSVVGEDQKNTSIYVDSVFEGSRQVDDSYEKIALEFEEQVVMSAPSELRFPSSDEDSCSEILVNGKMLINNENDEHVNAILDEAIEVDVDIMEYVKARDIIVVEDDLLVVEASEDEETIFINATTEVACANEVKVKDNLQVQFLKEEKQIDDCDDDMIPENCEGDLSNTCPTSPIMREDHQQMQYNNKQVVMGEEEEEEEEEEAVKADCVDVLSMKEIHVNEVRETTQNQLMNELLNNIEKEISHTQVIEAAKVDDNETLVEVVREDNPQEKIEIIAENEIPLFQPIQEEDVTDVCSDSSMQEEVTPELKMSNQKIEENIEENDEMILDKHRNDHKLWRWSILVLIWCLFHWYIELPYRELSLVASLLFIFWNLLAYRNTIHLR